MARQLDTTIDTEKKLRVTVTRQLPDAVERILSETFDVSLNKNDKPMSKADLIAAVATSDILLPTVTDRIDRDIVLSCGPNLKLIANFGVGVDHIDVKQAGEAGIMVTNTPGVLTDDTADLTIALIIGAMRRLFEGERAVRAVSWPGWAPTYMLGRSLDGKTLGIIGMGRIGCAVARRAAAFGLKIIYHSRRRLSSGQEKALKAEYIDDVDRLLSGADIISLHCPLTPETHLMINRTNFQKMKPGAVLINTARGSIIDEGALAEMLAKGRIAAAALDVYTEEPNINEKLLGLDNVALVPHMGSATVETRTLMGMKALENIKAFAAGKPLPDRV